MIGSAAGVCQKHQMVKMFVGADESALEPICVKCQAENRPKSGLVVTTGDPGEDFFKGGPAGPQKEPTVVRTAVAVNSLTLEDVVVKAINDLNSLPMPKDIKQFKAVQKAIKTLESLVEKFNG